MKIFCVLEQIDDGDHDFEFIDEHELADHIAKCRRCFVGTVRIPKETFYTSFIQEERMVLIETDQKKARNNGGDMLVWVWTNEFGLNNYKAYDYDDYAMQGNAEGLKAIKHLIT
jgi:hypothetical protein